MNCLLCSSHKTISRVICSAESFAELWDSRFSIDVRNEISGVSEIIRWTCLSCGLQFYDPQLVGGSDFYEQLQEKKVYKYKWEHKVAKSYVKEGESLLDIGCGSGEFIQSLSGIPGVKCLGLEFNTKAIELAKANGVNVVNLDLYVLAKSKLESFDVICLFQVLEHVPDPRRFVETCVSLLKPGGKFIIAVPNGDSFIKHMPRHLLNMPPHHISVFGKKIMKIIESLFDIKLEYLRCEPLKVYHRDMFYNAQIDRIPKVRYITWPLIGFLRKHLSRICATFNCDRFFNGQGLLAVYTKSNLVDM